MSSAGKAYHSRDALMEDAEAAVAGAVRSGTQPSSKSSRKVSVVSDFEDKLVQERARLVQLKEAQEHSEAIAAVAAAAAEHSHAVAGSSPSAPSAHSSGGDYVPNFEPPANMPANDADPDVSILYQPGGAPPRLNKYLFRLIEFRVSSRFMITRNKEVQARHIWGGAVPEHIRKHFPFVDEKLAQAAQAATVAAAASAAAATCPTIMESDKAPNGAAAGSPASAATGSTSSSSSASSSSSSSSGVDGSGDVAGDLTAAGSASGMGDVDGPSSLSASLSASASGVPGSPGFGGASSVGGGVGGGAGGASGGHLGLNSLGAGQRLITPETATSSTRAHAAATAGLANYCLSRYIYSDDSDIVAILHHTAHIPLRPTAPSYVGLSVICRVLPALPFYSSTDNAGLLTRDWPQGYQRWSLQLIRTEVIERTNIFQPYRRRKLTADGKKPRGEVRLVKMQLASDRPGTAASLSVAVIGHGHGVIPVAGERPKRRQAPDTSLMFTYNNDPCYAYSPAFMQDHGAYQDRWTAAMLAGNSFYIEVYPTRSSSSGGSGSSSASSSGGSAGAAPAVFEISLQGTGPTGYPTYRLAFVNPSTTSSTALGGALPVLFTPTDAQAITAQFAAAASSSSAAAAGSSLASSAAAAAAAAGAEPAAAGAKKGRGARPAKGAGAAAAAAPTSASPAAAAATSASAPSILGEFGPKTSAVLFKYFSALSAVAPQAAEGDVDGDVAPTLSSVLGVPERLSQTPLPASSLTVIASGLDWTQFVWGPTSVAIAPLPQQQQQQQQQQQAAAAGASSGNSGTPFVAAQAVLSRLPGVTTSQSSLNSGVITIGPLATVEVRPNHTSRTPAAALAAANSGAASTSPAAWSAGPFGPASLAELTMAQALGVSVNPLQGAANPAASAMSDSTMRA